VSARQGAGVVLELRVYLEDTDAQGVVYHASYLRFMERARSEWLRSCGFDHDSLREVHGSQVVLSAIQAKFRSAAQLDETLCVSADVVETRGARVVFAQEVRRGDRCGALICEARAEVACVSAYDRRPKRLPSKLVGERKR
jgi:tol-pal system-associated acyl-CoA thioesterase